LQRALEIQSSTYSEEKNKIKTSIKKYFNSRECYTLISPFVEGKSSLRSEFEDQMAELRMKVKKMKGV